MKHYKLVWILTVLLFVNAGCKSEAQNKITIYTIGDSTMADKKNPDQNPEHGWGQVLPQFFTEDVTIANHAVNGRSSRSFFDEGRWEKVLNSLKEGDYVFIQFGHNDQKIKDPKRYTNPHTAYRYFLKKYVEEARQKGAIPVLFSSIVRRNFTEDGVLADTHGVYPMEVRLLASELDVPFIDLQYLTEVLEESYGVEDSMKLHLHFEKGEHPYYPDGKNDDTHLSEKGAVEVAGLAVKALAEKVPALQKYMR